MEVRPGYKQTEVGVIPMDWRVRSLGSMATMVASGRSSAGRSTGDFPVYGSTGIIGYTQNPEYEGNAILVARVGANAGKLNLVSGNYGVTDNTIMLRLSGDSYLPYYWRQLESKRLNSLVFGSGQPLITGTQLKALPMAVPNGPEQKAIASALDDVDELLSGLDRLIAKKRDLKQAAMQQLLTGQSRLPGFQDQWEMKALGSFVEIKKGELITEASAVPGSIPVIAGGKQPAYYHNRANRSGKTITISGSGASAGYISFHRSAIFASDCSTISEGKSYSIEFVFFLLQSRQDEIYRAQTGGAQPHIHPNDLRPIVVSVPQPLEQNAIAEVLSDMDAELAALEQRREKTRALKQAMMQELLTGNTRLV